MCLVGNAEYLVAIIPPPPNGSLPSRTLFEARGLGLGVDRLSHPYPIIIHPGCDSKMTDKNNYGNKKMYLGDSRMTRLFVLQTLWF